MAVSLSLSTSVTYPSSTEATIKVTLKAKSTYGSHNNNKQSGYIKIDGTKYSFSHSFGTGTTTLATKSKTVSRGTSARSVSVSGYYKSGVSSGNVSKSSSVSVAARPKYTVYFYDGSGNYTTSSVFYGYTTTFPHKSKTGHTLLGYRKYVNGALTGSTYSAGTATPAVTASVVYTATWKANTYKVTLNAQGGTVSSTSLTKTYGQSLSLPTPSREGYTFNGWWTKTGGTGTKYTSSYTGNAAVTLYASWIVRKYTISLNPNGGVVSTSRYTRSYGQSITLPTPSRTGYTFTGWYNSSGTKYSTFVVKANVSLSARWTLKTYTITLNLNGGGSVSGSTTLTKKYSSVLSLPTPSRSGYSFNGWNTNSSGTGTTFLSTYNINESRTLYAVWEENETTTITNVILHNYNSATSDGTSNRKTVYKVSDKNLILPTPSLSNYIFGGWYNNSSYTGSSISSITSDDNIPTNLYAKWITTYKIRYNLNSSYEDGVEPEGNTNVITTRQNVAAALEFQGYFLVDNVNSSSGLTYYEAEENFFRVSSSSAADLDKYYELSDDEYVLASSPYDSSKTYYIKDDSYVVASNIDTNEDYYIKDNFKYIGYGANDFTKVQNPVVTDIENYYEISNNEYIETTDTILSNDKDYYIHGIEKCIFAGWTDGNNNTYTENGTNTLTISSGSAGAVTMLNAIWTPKNFTQTFKRTSDDNNPYTTPQTYYTTFNLPQESTIGGAYVEYLPIDSPNVENIAQYYELINNEYVITSDSVIVENKTYYNKRTYHLYKWKNITNISSVEHNVNESFLVTRDNTFEAQWVVDYNRPELKATIERVSDEEGAILSGSGHYIKINVEGNNGDYVSGSGIISTLNEYDIEVEFLDDDDFAIGSQIYRRRDGVNGYNGAEYVQVIDPRYESLDEYYEHIDDSYVKTTDDIIKNEKIYYVRRKVNENIIIKDKQLACTKCIVTFVDMSNYNNNQVSNEDRTITYEYEVELDRDVAIHIADNLKAISLFDELVEGDEGLVVHKPIVMSSLWAWKIDKNQHLYLEWIGAESTEQSEEELEDEGEEE